MKINIFTQKNEPLQIVIQQTSGDAVKEASSRRNASKLVKNVCVKFLSVLFWSIQAIFLAGAFLLALHSILLRV